MYFIWIIKSFVILFMLQHRSFVLHMHKLKELDYKPTGILQNYGSNFYDFLNV